MPSDKPDEVKKWRHPVTAVQTLEPAAFAEKVIENGLRVTGPFQGYLYAAVKTDDGYDMLRMPQKERYFYSATRVATQANAAGGAIAVDITPTDAGQAFIIRSCRMVNSGTNTANIYVYDEDNYACAKFAAVASAAGTSATTPNIGGTGGTSDNLAQGLGYIVPYTFKLTCFQSGAGAQNDTLTCAVILELLGTATEPSWSKARSTNQANVTLAASTISAEGTLVTVVAQE